MAEFQSNAPQMFQLPSNVTQSSLGAGLATGANQGIGWVQAQQALNMQKQQQTISQVDTLLKNGLNYPGMLPTFWPAIATRMNSLSPDYQLDPNNPPENLKNFATQLSSISDGLQDKAVSPLQAHAATKQLIQSSYLPPAPSDGGQGVAPSQATPSMQAPQGQPPQSGMGQPPQQPPASNPLTDFVAIKAQYDKANQLISQAPMEGPQSQENLRKQLEASSLGLNYKKALDNLSQQYGEGQQNQRNQFNQDQDSIRSLTGSFESQSQDAKNVFDNLNVFNSQMNLSRQFAGSKDTTGAVNAEKASLLAFAQMAYPGTGRPGNQEMLENMEKSGPYGTLIEQSLNKLSKGEIMTDSQIKGLRQAAISIATAREQSQTDQENTTARAIQMHGGQPEAFLRNYRPSSMISTSRLFPSQGTPNRPLIGEIRKGYKFLGGDGTDKDNWIPAETNEQ